MLEGIVNSKSKTFTAWGQSPSTRFLFYCSCFLLGVLVISIIDKKIPFVWLYFLSFVILSFIIIFWSNTKIHFVLLCLSALLFGMWRYQLAFPILKNNISNFTGQKMIVTGNISAEPDIRQGRVNYVVSVVAKDNSPVHGKIYFRYNLYPRFNYGDILKMNCELQVPEAFDDFRYDRYLNNQGVFIICNKPQIEKIGEGGSFIFKNLFRLKEMVASKVGQLWNEPYAGFMGGILYGYRGGLGTLNELFSRTGITHIIAISGYNISIIAGVLINLFSFLLVPRKKAFWLITMGIVLFVVFTGVSASVVRAGVMGILVLVARQIGRVSRMGNVLVFTAFIMVLINPFILVWDAGFQLSFLSTLGLVYLSPLLVIPRSHSDEGSFEVKGQRNTKEFSRSLVVHFERFLAVCGRLGMTETLSAIIATLPLILFQFGRLSIVALPVNILILWIIPFLMLGGFLAVVLSFIFYPLAQVIGWITFAGMKYVVVIVNWFGSLRWAAIDLQIPWWLMILMYLGIIYVIWRKKLKF